MKPTYFSTFLPLVCLLLPLAALAERADRDKPMNIEADALRYDDAKQTSEFTGRVVLTKGTMLIRGARLDVRQDPDGNQFGVVKAEPGKLAFFRQKRDTKAGTADEYMEGEAELIEYDGRADTVKFTRRAQLRRYVGATLNDEMTGAVIVYDNSTSILTVDGAPAKGGDAAGAGAGRVRAVLTPRVNEKAPASAAPAPVLRQADTMAGEKK